MCVLFEDVVAKVRYCAVMAVLRAWETSASIAYCTTLNQISIKESSFDHHRETNAKMKKHFFSSKMDLQHFERGNIHSGITLCRGNQFYNGIDQLSSSTRHKAYDNSLSRYGFLRHIPA
jgi:hypothetical protein